MNTPGINPVSPRLHELLQAVPHAYEKLVVDGQTPPGNRKLLEGITPDELLSVPVKSRAHAYAMLAGVWLWLDGLAEAHEIAQADPRNLIAPIQSPQENSSKLSLAMLTPPAEGKGAADEERYLADAGRSLAFWHAVMHRLEGDFSNSQYWYAKVGSHPILPAIGATVGAAINHLPADKSLLGLLRDDWNPYAFVELVEEVNGKPNDPRRATVIAIQQVEWQMLFDHCTRQACGR